MEELRKQGIAFDIHPVLQKSMEKTFRRLEGELSTAESIAEFNRTHSEWKQKMLSFAGNPAEVVATHNRNVEVQNTLFAVSQFISNPEQMKIFLKTLNSR